MNLEVREPRESELDQHAALHDEGYGLPAGTGRARADDDRAAGLVERMLGAYDGERLVGRLIVLPFGQFFGGRPMPMGGISQVVVAADARGSGVGRALLDAAFGRMRAHGEVVSALSPATVPIYRNAGWELAGDQHVYRLPIGDLARCAPTPRRVRRVEPGDHDAIKRCYVRFAGARNGMLARPAFLWQRRFQPDPAQRRYVVEHDGGDVTAYISYRCSMRSTAPGYRLVVDDFAALDWDSERALWHHLAGHRAQTDAVVMMCPPGEALALHIPEPTIERIHAQRWMLRIVDAAGAIAARGFPPSLHASVPLTIADPRVHANEGDWTLEVDGGRGVLHRESSGPPSSVAITINALAPLFSAAISARALAAAGLVSGASSGQLATLDAMFSGPHPAMSDRF
ncbi:MAG TPA: GNAT family N-acetyltransferase [Acidimicrobiia bacterium]|jgi:predicted acetyltransferase